MPRTLKGAQFKLRAVVRVLEELEDLPEEAFFNYRTEFTIYTNLTIEEVMKLLFMSLQLFAPSFRSKTL